MYNKWKKCTNSEITIELLVADQTRYGVILGDLIPGRNAKGELTTVNVCNLMSVVDVIQHYRYNLLEIHPGTECPVDSILSDFCVVNWINLSRDIVELNK